ncbi:hypothetical protein CRS92_08305, partial [Campylobacter coli]|nr:hypothetical protein [Campylobacter coli]
LNFIEVKKDEINKVFSKWFVIRNEGFEEFKIYDNRKDEVTYAMGFEPDFIFCRRKNKMSQKKNKMSYFCDKLSFFQP